MRCKVTTVQINTEQELLRRASCRTSGVGSVLLRRTRTIGGELTTGHRDRSFASYTEEKKSSRRRRSDGGHQPKLLLRTRRNKQKNAPTACAVLAVTPGPVAPATTARTPA